MSDFTDNPPPERKPPRGTEETDFPVPAQPPPLAKGISGRERLMTILASAAVAALVTVVVVFGLQAYHANVPREDTLPRQKGSVSVPARETVDVFYPVPYATPPNVTLSGSFVDDDIVITDQKADSFKLKNKSSNFSRTVLWKAEGRPLK